MRYSEAEVGLYWEDWERVLADCETRYSVDAETFTDAGIVDVLDNRQEVSRG
jgi:hypothetical protein